MADNPDIRIFNLTFRQSMLPAYAAVTAFMCKQQEE